MHSSNVLVEISAAGVTKSQAYYANSLALQLTENYGQVRVAHEQTGKPIPKTYVKVYARMQDGNVRFYKDGYTDLRGRFDYTSLNTNELDFVSKFSLLILSDQHGAVVREATRLSDNVTRNRHLADVYGVLIGWYNVSSNRF